MVIRYSLGIKRDRVAADQLVSSTFDEEYDFRILFHNAFFDPQSCFICLICLKSLNLGDFMRTADFQNVIHPVIATPHVRQSMQRTQMN
jgi:hypothetical protein